MKKLNYVLAKTGYSIRQYSPEILLGVSIASNAGAVIHCGKASAKLVDVRKLHIENVTAIHADIDNGKISAEEGKKILKKEYVTFIRKAGVAYIPTVICFGIGTAASIGVHKVLTVRNERLSALLAGTTAAFASYREKVKQLIGEDEEKKLANGIVGKKEVTDENGDKKMVDVVDTSVLPCTFTIVLNKDNWRLWDDNLGCTISFLQMREEEINSALRTDGGITAARQFEIVGITNDMLTPEQINAAHVMGNLYDPNDPTLTSHISLGLCDSSGRYTDRAYNHIRNDNPYITVTFRFDGDIINGVNGDKNKTIAKYLKYKYSLGA